MESQPSGLYSDNTTPTFQAHSQMIRSRAETNVRSESQASNQYKRLSLVSSESAGTSGIHDMSASYENETTKTEISQPRTSLKASNSFTLPRKPNYQRNDSESRIMNSNTANALVDMPFRQVRFQDSDSDASFVRNTLKRRTLHVEFAMEDTDGPDRRQAGRTKSSPLAIAKQSDIQPPEALDEVDEETTDEVDTSCDDRSSCTEVNDDPPSSRRSHSVSVTSLPLSPTPAISPMQASTPCLASASPQATTLPASKSSGSLHFTFPTKKKGEKSKEKGKEKQKKVCELQITCRIFVFFYRCIYICIYLLCLCKLVQAA